MALGMPPSLTAQWVRLLSKRPISSRDIYSSSTVRVKRPSSVNRKTTSSFEVCTSCTVP